MNAEAVEQQAGTTPVADRQPIVEMRNINVAFGGVHAVRDVSIDLHAGEVGSQPVAPATVPSYGISRRAARSLADQRW